MHIATLTSFLCPTSSQRRVYTVKMYMYVLSNCYIYVLPHDEPHCWQPRASSMDVSWLFTPLPPPLTPWTPITSLHRQGQFLFPVPQHQAQANVVSGFGSHSTLITMPSDDTVERYLPSHTKVGLLLFSPFRLVGRRMKQSHCACGHSIGTLLHLDRNPAGIAICPRRTSCPG